MILTDDERLARVLSTRMRRLAEPLLEMGRPENTMSVAVFLLEKERYAMELISLREVLAFDRCTPLPTASPEILGIVNVRGDIRPVLSLKRLLGLPASEDENGGYVLFLEGAGGALGLRVDQIVAIQLLARDRIKVLGEGRNASSRYISGWTSEGITLLGSRAFLDWNHQ